MVALIKSRAQKERLPTPLVLFVTACRGLPPVGKTRRRVIQEDLMAFTRLNPHFPEISEISNVITNNPNINNFLSLHTSTAQKKKSLKNVDIHFIKRLRMTLILKHIETRLFWKGEAIDPVLIKSLLNIALDPGFIKSEWAVNPLIDLSFWYGAFKLTPSQKKSILGIIKKLTPQYQARINTYNRRQPHTQALWYRATSKEKNMLPYHVYHPFTIDTLKDLGYNKRMALNITLSVETDPLHAFIIGLFIPEHIQMMIHGGQNTDHPSMNPSMYATNQNWHAPSVSLEMMKRVSVKDFVRARLRSTKFKEYMKIVLPYIISTSSTVTYFQEKIQQVLFSRGNKKDSKKVYDMTFRERMKLALRVIHAIKYNSNYNSNNNT
jgi:hypothetical protein